MNPRVSEMDRDTIVYLGNFEFPDRNAPGKRVLANGYILRELGYRVIFVGMDRHVLPSQSVQSTRREYDGFTYYSFRYPRSNLEWMNYPASYQRFLELVRENDLEERMLAVISYGSLSLSLWSLRVLSWCRKRSIGYVEDCVDWLSVSYGSLFFRAAKWLDDTLKRTYINSRADGVIAVTTYLQDYYRRRGRKTVLIPPLSVYSPWTQVTRAVSHDRAQLIYAGIPFRFGRPVRDCRHFKDRIDKAISYLYSAYRAGHRFVFHIYGFTRQDFLQALPDFTDIVHEMGESLDFGGFLDNTEIMKRVRAADFTFLIRDDNRSTRAGFPTKVTESISCGTPVITTRTSDLAHYLTDGEQVCWVSFDDKEAAEDVVRVLSLPRTQIERMKSTCARSKAFAYQNHVAKMRDFLEDLGL